jgi:tetratricopeptide (TPR) repeat protein
MTQLFRCLVFLFCLITGSVYAANDSPLFEAVKKGDKAAVEVLLAKGADANAKDTNGRTPLHWAAIYGNKDIAELFLAKGADVNAKDTDGWTPLHRAAYWDRKNVAVLLLAHGADVNAKERDGWTPLHRATYWGKKKDMVALLEEHSLKQARGNPHAAFLELTAQLKNKPSDTVSRRLIIKLARELKPTPTISEEARKHFVEGTAIVKAAKNPAQQALAAQSFTEALKVAPWWGDAYYNLGVAQELAEKYNEAEQAFNFYLLSNPKATEKREVQDRIYGLSAKRKLLGAK